MSDQTVTILRLVITSMSAFLVGSTLVVSIAYLRAWTRRGTRTWRGLLPLHVFTVTASYDLLLIFATIEIMLKLDNGDVGSWRLFFLPPVYLLGFLSMYTIAKFRKTRQLRESDTL